LIVQKTVCLLKLLGFELDYSFNSLYIRGPYCPELTNDLYEYKTAKFPTPTEQEKIKLNELKELSNELNPTMLEIMGTYAFLVHGLKKNEKEAILTLKKLKSFYSESDFAVGMSKAKQLFLKLSKKEIEEIKKEGEDWEQASLSDTRE